MCVNFRIAQALQFRKVVTCKFVQVFRRWTGTRVFILHSTVGLIAPFNFNGGAGRDWGGGAAMASVYGQIARDEAAQNFNRKGKGNCVAVQNNIYSNILWKRIWNYG